MITKILLLGLIAVIFLIAWVITNKHKNKTVASKDDFRELSKELPITEIPLTTAQSFKRFARRYTRLPRREYFRVLAEARHRRHKERVAKYEQQNIFWTPTGLYWMTHALAVENGWKGR